MQLKDVLEYIYAIRVDTYQSKNAFSKGISADDLVTTVEYYAKDYLKALTILHDTENSDLKVYYSDNHTLMVDQVVPEAGFIYRWKISFKWNIGIRELSECLNIELD